MAAACGNCAYGRAAPASAGIGDGRLSCCRTAPILEGPPFPPPSPTIWPFPQVLPDFWCGEYAPSGAGLPGDGITDGSVAAPGWVGEVLSSLLPVASGVAIGSAVTTQITSLTLSPGDWDLWGEVAIGNPVGGGLTLSFTSASLWRTAAADPAPNLYPADGANAADYCQLAWPGNIARGPTIILGPLLVNVTTATIFYLNATVTYAATSVLVGGAIRARRRR